MKDGSPEMMSIFCGALERSSSEERAAYLDAACAASAGMRERIDALLRAHEEAGGFLGERPEPGDPETPVDLPEQSGTVIGPLRRCLTENTSFRNTVVIAPATHDTGSAVAAISAREGTAFLSSGTWSLVGTEIDQPMLSIEALRLNFTNEGGVEGTTRLLKNVMGLWMLQECRQTWAAQGQKREDIELLEMAARETPFSSLVDPDDESFLRPASMPAAIDAFCRRTDQPLPKTHGAYVRTICESLAFKYRLVVRHLETLIDRPIEKIRIIGGGSKNRLLNQFTADATGKLVLAGPAEATAIGNVAMQILATGGASSLREVRAIVDRSFPAEVFSPLDADRWNQSAERFEHYCGVIHA